MNTKPLLNLTLAGTDLFDRDLMCCVNRLAYDMKTRTGYIDLPDGSCTDMGGAMNLFMAIDRDVRQILAGDTCYRRRAGGEWSAVSATEEQRIKVAS